MSRWKRLRWRSASDSRGSSFAEEDENTRGSVLSTEASIPFIGGSPLGEALGLLEQAADIEHALTVEYLYAAFTSPHPSISSKLLEIAHEEMAHLITVQNLRLLCGGDPFLGRQDQSPNPDDDPFPFQLAPLSLDSLARYAVCESPDIVSDQNTFDEMLSRAEVGLSAKVNRVAHFYQKIYWLFMEDDVTVGPWIGFDALKFATAFPAEKGRHIQSFPGIGSADFQADENEWQVAFAPGSMLVDSCVNREDALRALTKLVSQGEGPVTGSQSHFERFTAAYVAARDASLTPLNVVVDPTTDLRMKPGSLIIGDIPLSLSRLCDGIYHCILAETVMSLTIHKTIPGGAEVRSDLIASALTGMRNVPALFSMMLSNDLASPPTPGSPRPGPAFMPFQLFSGTREHALRAYEDANLAIKDSIGHLSDIEDPTGNLSQGLSDWGRLVESHDSLAGRIRLL
jgi:hypothetical protein